MAEWSHGLFGCFDNMGICCMSYFLPCVVAGQNAEKAKVGGCCLYGCLSICGPCGIYFLAKVRESVREQKDIEGSFGEDCLLSWFCSICSLIQVAQELEGAGAMGQSMARV